MRYKLAGLTPLQAEILKKLYTFYQKYPKLHLRGVRPVQVGAEANTAHYDSLKRLVDHGLVSRDADDKSRSLYRICGSGVQKWEFIQALSQTPEQTLLGNAESRRKLKLFADLVAK